MSADDPLAPYKLLRDATVHLLAALADGDVDLAVDLNEQRDRLFRELPAEHPPQAVPILQELAGITQATQVDAAHLREQLGVALRKTSAVRQVQSTYAPSTSRLEFRTEG